MNTTNRTPEQDENTSTPETDDTTPREQDGSSTNRRHIDPPTEDPDED
jgi:hypothetical protein